MRNNIFVLSGLGADERIFYKLNFGINNNVTHLPWITALPNEPFEAYAKRIAADIPGKENVIVIGLSFGGMVAAEIARQLPCKKVILISSAKDGSEIPRLYKLAGKIGLLKIMNLVSNKLFSTRATEDKMLVQSMIQKADTSFLNWAVNTIVKLKSKPSPANLVHIHGTNDRILPYKNINATHTIKGGKHLMLVNNSAELQQYLDLYV
jgi:pimeloyl-ACP methyl ester carboxylesterase